MNQLFKIRHTAEHVLHQAVKELYPNIYLAMGPATENGFYFDFDPSPEGGEDVKITSDQFPEIEKRMQEIIDLDLPMTKIEIPEEEARSLFSNNPYKLDWIEKIVAENMPITIYWTGDPDQEGSMVDLCKGPHANSTGEIKAFKLLSVAGAYWHGDEKNKMLTRIYGTAFPSKKELRQYLWQMEEAKKRDHKKLGIELDLFTFSEKVGSGLPLWTPKGTEIRNALDEFVWQLRKKKGYKKVEIPHITKKDLYETSGHWDKFKDELFRINTREKHEFAMKPMNCPHHTQIFDRKSHSYREMPARYANTTMVYRDEQTGELSGLSRVRSITQDDAHVFCRGSQIKQEMMAIWDIIDEFYQAVGFDLYVRLSLSDPDQPDKYLGKRDLWIDAENQLRELAKERGVEVQEAIGEAAFYGPKLDFMAKDSLGREWQVATNQLDFNMPERFGLSCINESGEKEQIFMLHAAIMGSIERYMSILIEHFAGAFPVWLSPVQVAILPINDSHLKYAQSIFENLQNEEIRVELWAPTDSIGKRVRNAEKQKIPHMIILGDKEQSDQVISTRNRGGSKAENVKMVDFIAKIKNQIKNKELDSYKE